MDQAREAVTRNAAGSPDGGRQRPHQFPCEQGVSVAQKLLAGSAAEGRSGSEVAK